MMTSIWMTGITTNGKEIPINDENKILIATKINKQF